MWLLCWCATPAPALVVAVPDEVATRPPRATAGLPPFPYWEHVVSLGNYSAVYLGERWVLTAGHVGVGDVVIRGQRYKALPDSEIDLRTGFLSADLALFRIERDPGLAAVALPLARPAVGDGALLLGWGRAAGDDLEWRGRPGHYWAQGPPRLRWGHNRVSRLGVRLGTKDGAHTESFALRFGGHGESLRATQAAQGDSGGAVFLEHDGRWMLGGILLMIQRHRDQPWNTAIEGNQTFAADLALYVEQIEAITGLRRTAAE